MSNVTRVFVKVNQFSDDPKKELDVALSKLKRKIKDTNTFVDYIEHQSFRRPAVRRRDKARKALARKRYEERILRRQRRQKSESAEIASKKPIST